MNDKLLRKHLDHCIKTIDHHQRRDGGFYGYASPRKDDFNGYLRKHPTIFFTALITQACRDIKSAKSIRLKAIDYLLSSRSVDWSWNYWQRDNEGSTMRGYPDDLDDTACALSAIYSTDKSRVDGATLGALARLLINSEVGVGGPYQTWLFQNAAKSKWNDIDVSVNANIAFLLKDLDSMPNNLEHYLYRQIEQGKLSSSYYLGDIPTIYFIARIKSPLLKTLLTSRIYDELKKPYSTRSALMNALLISSCVNSGVSIKHYEAIVTFLLEKKYESFDTVSGIYKEPPIEGVNYYAGSIELTCALVAEAFQNVLNELENDKLSASHREPLVHGMEQIYHEANALILKELNNADMQEACKSALLRIKDEDIDGQIGKMASMFSQDCDFDIEVETLSQLQIGSIMGWAAYTLYDDVYDGDASVMKISAANVLMRKSVHIFKMALPNNAEFHELIDETFIKIDEANQWELKYTRFEPGKFSDIDGLPTYGKHEQLANRSLGHVLSTCGVLYAAGYTSNSVEVRQWIDFMYDFIIARQLNDDAHDWQEDSEKGMITSVVSMLLQRARNYVNAGEAVVPSMKEMFWTEILDDIATTIYDHLDNAEDTLKDMRFIKNKKHYQALLTPLRNSVDEALEGRKNALDFIKVYSK